MAQIKGGSVANTTDVTLSEVTALELVLKNDFSSILGIDNNTNLLPDQSLPRGGDGIFRAKRRFWSYFIRKSHPPRVNFGRVKGYLQKNLHTGFLKEKSKKKVRIFDWPTPHRGT